MFIDTFQLKGRHNFVPQIFVHICHLLLFHKVEKSVLALVPMSKSNFFDDSFHDRQKSVDIVNHWLLHLLKVLHFDYVI